MENKETLLKQLASKENLMNAWNLLNKENLESHGLSGMTIKKFSQNLDSNLDQIHSELLKGTFNFSSTRAAIIKKDTGKFRPLQIPEIRDRVVLKAMAILLEQNLNEILLKSEGISFAYQQGKGVREAILKMKSSYQQGRKIILKADIINFFEEVKKDKLLNELIFPNLKDDSINKLITESISQNLGGRKKINKQHQSLFKNAGNGIPQGNPLSPLLSNIYLSDFDLYLKHSGYSLIRYADDFLVLFNSAEEAKKGYEKISIFLKESFSLLIHPLDEGNGKTEIIDPKEIEFSFLSIKFDGDNIYPNKSTLGFLKGKIKNLIKTTELNPLLFKNINEIIEKWIAPYSYLDIERYFDDIDNYVISNLTKKFGKNNYKITKCRKLAQKVRTKQYEKGEKSFWRNSELKSILPQFIRQIKRVAFKKSA